LVEVKVSVLYFSMVHFYNNMISIFWTVFFFQNSKEMCSIKTQIIKELYLSSVVIQCVQKVWKNPNKIETNDFPEKRKNR
jgi:hypothetical protein